MFWSKKKKTDKQTGSTGKNGAARASYGDVGTTNKSQRTGGGAASAKTGAELRAEALANARGARERIGEETIQKIAEALRKKQESALEQAKQKIARENSGRVADEIRFMMDDKDKT